MGGVQFIYDAVIASLSRNPDRTFTAVEMGFMLRWLVAADPVDAAAAVALVQRGSLTLTNAGWCMADEAAPTWGDMADNLSLGHRLAASFFGQAVETMPRVGWQIGRDMACACGAAHMTNVHYLGCLLLLTHHGYSPHKHTRRSYLFEWRVCANVERLRERERERGGGSHCCF